MEEEKYEGKGKVEEGSRRKWEGEKENQKRGGKGTLKVKGDSREGKLGVEEGEQEKKGSLRQEKWMERDGKEK